MENLYQRLKEEIVIALDSKKDEFPALTSKIITELKDKEYVSDVSYGTFCDLQSFVYKDTLFEYFKDQK